MKLLEHLFITASNAKMFVKKHSPTILTICSVGATLGAVAATAKSTWDAKEIIELHNSEIDNIHKELEEHNDLETRKKLARKYLETAADVTDVYLAPVLLTGISVASSIMSNRISNSRIAALGASYTLIKQLYDRYRNRVKEKYGEEADQDILYGAKEVEKEIVDKKGKVKKVKDKEYSPLDIVSNNPCSVLLGPGIDSVLVHDGGEKQKARNRSYNKNVLLSIENRATYEIDTRGYIFWSDIAKELGIRPSSKEEKDRWDNWGIIKSEERVNNKINEIRYKFNREPTIDEIRDANRLDLGLDKDINERWRSGDEEMIWIVPNLDGDISTLVFPSYKEKQHLEELYT